MSVKFVLNETSYFGKGAREELPGEIQKRGFHKVLVVTDKSLAECGVTTRVTEVLDKAGIAYEVYSDVKPNPTIKNVTDGVEVCRNSGADVIVAVGGGSSIDTAKGISIVMTNPDRADIVSLNGASNTVNRGMPIIALPTTSGTAAEVTINYVITDEEAIEKMGLAQYIAGMGFSNVGLGIVHSMAHQLGAVYDTPHGMANAILLPTVMRFNGEDPATAQRFREILMNIGRPDAEHLNDQDVINTFVWMISELSKSVGITQTVRDVGAKEEDFDMLAEKAMQDPCKPGNPRDVSKEDFIELFRRAM